MVNSKSILFVCPYPPGHSPSQRFRFEQYFGILRSHGYTINIRSFLDEDAWAILYKEGRTFRKINATLAGFVKRFFLLFSVHRYDFVFIHREATPVGPPWFEWIVAVLFRKKVIYDFDDAIWSTDIAGESWLSKLLKWRSKIKFTVRWAHKVSCGNEYLRDFAIAYNKRTIVNPTTIDTDHLHNPELHNKRKDRGDRVVIGWTGSHSTLKYLQTIENVLQRVELNSPSIEVLVIADQRPPLKLDSLRFVPWAAKTEIEDLMRLDIGIMPLPDDEWAKGKCGFKALQYLALKIPAVASPVGVNSKIIDHGINGFLCGSEEEWAQALINLINDGRRRKEMGELGRLKVINSYSVTSNSASFLSLFE